jgi:hypothetical protein
MGKRGLLFGFEEPNGWNAFREGDRYVFHGPSGAELIVSAVLAHGGSDELETERFTERAFKNALDAALQTASDPALVVRRGLARAVVRPPLEVWTVDSVTKDGTTVFLQAIARAPGGVLLATLECSNAPETAAVFDAFLESLRLVLPTAEA